jgi:hypothetical protein
MTLRVSETTGDAVVIPFPCPAVRSAFALLQEEGASELERALAASILVLVVKQGEAVVPGTKDLLRRLLGPESQSGAGP